MEIILCVCVSVCSQKIGKTTNIDSSNELLADFIMNAFIFTVKTMNQVMNVRAHVYKPLLNGDSITAQLIWQPLQLEITPSSYDIRIFTADSSMEMIAVCTCVYMCV